MKITVLTENTSVGELPAEHGLSLYIEAASGRRILFDMGQTALFAENAAALLVDLSSVDTAVLSHGHYDHGGGISAFLGANAHAPVYMSHRCFGEHYNASEKYIGLDKSLQDCNRIIPTDKDTSLGDGITLLQGEARDPKYPIEAFGLTIKRDGALCDEDFLHEQYMMIEENGKKVLFSGCSHRGIFNILDWFRPDVFIGGFHFTKLDPETEDGGARLLEFAERLMKYPCEYYTCHCTGVAQYGFLKEIMKERIDYVCAGRRFQI